MADKCGYCGEKTPTNHLVLNGGALWIEFCKPCGDKETLTNQDGETFTIQQIFDKSGDKATKKEVVNHYHNENQQDIYEDIQKGYPQNDDGDALCELLFNSKQDIESLLNQCEHSGKYTQEELILFVETVRTEGI
jgi:hypothetical protein